MKRAEREFRERIAALGGRVIEPVWLGARTGHRVICVNGGRRVAVVELH